MGKIQTPPLTKMTIHPVCQATKNWLLTLPDSVSQEELGDRGYYGLREVTSPNRDNVYLHTEKATERSIGL